MADSNKKPDEIEPALPGLANGEGECAPSGSENPVAAKRGPGRPAGSVNRKTKTLQKWLDALGYRHPAVVLAEMASASVDEIAERVNCKKLEALDIKRKAASDLLPYFEGKILSKTDDGEQPLPVLNINVNTDTLAQQGLTAGDGAISVFSNIQQNQEVIDVEPEPSHIEPSHSDDKTQSNQELNDAEPSD